MQIEQGSNSLRAKITNQSAILKIIYYFGPIKRAEIARRLDLTLPTITTNVNSMIAEGIVREVSVRGTAGRRTGRKAHLLEIVPEARHFIGVEITGNRRSICVVDYCGKERCSYYDEETCMDYEKNMGETSRIVKDCLKQCSLDWQDIFGVCIALPGLVDSREGILKAHPGNQWTDKNIRRDFVALTGYDGPVAVENNTCVRASGVKLYRRDLLADVQSFAYLFVDRGIACPLIVNSFNYAESVVGAGEVGHMVMEPGGAKCSCGNEGCLEAYSSDRAVTERCLEQMAEGKAGILNEICGGGKPGMRQILEAQRRGDPQVGQIVGTAVRMLGIAVANIVNFTSPDTLLIDGKLFWSEENRKLLLETARKNLCNKTYRGVESVFVEPKKDSGAKGAAAVAINMCMQ